MKKVLSFILALVMLIGTMPMQVFATEGTQKTEAVEVVTEPTEAPEAVHEHAYEAVVTEPTCTEQGYTTYTCDCGYSYVDNYVDAEGEHDFTEWSTIKEAAYNADGEESRKCNKCSHVEFRSVSVSVVTSGNLGKGTTPTDKVIYTLYSDGTMVLEGTGALFGIDWRGDNQPFIDYRKQVKHLIIGEGITSTTSGSLVKLSNLETIQFPSTLTHLPQNALMSCFRPDITELTIPATVVHLGTYSIGHYTGDNSAYFTDVIIENPNIQITDHTAVFNGGAKLDQLTLYSYGANNKVSAYAEKYGIRYVDLNNYLEGEYGDIHYELSNGILILEPLVDNASVPASNQPWAPYAQSITKIIVGDGIVSIPRNAFSDYPALTVVDLPSGLDSIGDGAFSVTQSSATLLAMALPRRLNSLGKDIFKGRNNVELTVYSGSLGAELSEPGVKLITKKVFKLMLIGNSYSEDASNGSHTKGSQLLDILQAMLGEDAEITVALLSSGGKGMHWHATQAEQGNSTYSFKVITTANPTWKSMGSYTSADALVWTDWDAVSLQPYNINVSTGQESVPYPDSTDPKFYHIEDSSAYMLDHVARYAPYADIYFYMHWAQTSSTVLNAALSNYNKNAAFMPQILEYAGTESGAQFKTIIPVGLSIQNARTTYLALLRYNTTAYADGNLNLVTDAQIGLQRDGGHVSFNIGRYIAGLTFAEMIIPKNMRANDYVLPEIRGTESVGKLPKEYSVIAQKAVHAAVESWSNDSLAVTNINGYTEDPTVAAEKTLESMDLSLNCGDAASIEQQTRNSVLSALPDDFAVDAIALNEETSTAAVTIRFGYTSVSVEVTYSLANHTYENGICTDCGATIPNPYVGKTIACVGDSITCGVGVTAGETDYVTLLAKYLGMEYIRLGASGTTLCTGGHRTCNLKQLTEGKLAGADVVTILMGINDFDQAKEGYYALGTIDSADTSTIYGAIHMWCQRIEELRKTESLADTEFYFLTPVITAWNHSVSAKKNWDQSKTTIHGYTLRDLCNAIIEVCALYDVPVIDLNLISGIYYNSAEDNNIGKVGGDGIHPGANGHAMMAFALENALLKNNLKDDHTHTFGSWITTTYPGCYQGEQKHVCSVCSATESRQLDALGHTYENGTCTGCGDHIGPVITQQPESTEVPVGEKLSITVKAEGEGLTYQWYYKNQKDKDFRISSYNSNTYTITMKEAYHLRQVYCVITDIHGNTVTTETATMSRPPVELKITKQPQDVQVEVGERAVITVEAEGEGLKYQWYYKNHKGKDFQISSRKSNTYTLTLKEAYHLRQVYCVITDIYGNTVTTDVATMSRPPVELKITKQPQDVQVEVDERAVITVEAEGEGLKYQWYYKNHKSKDFQISSRKSNTYTLTLKEAYHLRQVYCVITDIYGNTVTTDVATMSRPPVELKITKQPQDVQVEVGEPVVITVEAEGDGLKYQWYYKNHKSKDFQISSRKSNTYTLTLKEAYHLRQVYCVITDIHGNTVTTETATMSRPPVELKITKQPQDVQVEVDERAVITVEAEGEGLKYQWYYKNRKDKDFRISSYKSHTYPITMKEAYHLRQVYCVITDIYGNTVTTDVATMSRPPVELKITKQPQDVQVEVGEPVVITVEAEGDGLKYQWYYKDKKADDFMVSSRQKATYSTTMASYCHLRQVYCVITDQYGNSVTTETVTLSHPPVELKILSQPADMYAEIGEKVRIGFNVQGDGLKYQWYYKNQKDKDFRISAYKNNTYPLSMTESYHLRQVYCVITDAYGNTVTTDVATIHAK